MDRDKIIETLKANVDRQISVTFVDGSVDSLVVTSVNNEGFVNKIEGGFYWSTFEDVADISDANTSSN